MAHVKAVCTSTEKGQAKKPVDSVEVWADFGVVGDAHAGNTTHRQVSLLDESNIDIMRRKGYDAADGDFGENMVTAGLPIDDLGIGTVLQIGDMVRLRISQIGKACHAPCAIGQRIGECIMPTKGLFATVTKQGLVKAGDKIIILHKVARQTIQAAVITISDRRSQGLSEDTSGPCLAQTLEEELRCNIAMQCIIPDERGFIEEHLIYLSEYERMIDLIFTTGGTGFAPRDVTPEATAAVIDRPAPGISEAIRLTSMQITPMAMLSRATAGIRNRALIINLPGSTKAVSESLQVLLPVLNHAVELLRNQVADCGSARSG